MYMTMQHVPMNEARRDLKSILDRVKTTHERFAITRHGEVDAVVMSPDDLDSLLETLDVLKDSDLMNDIREARAELARGEGVPLDEVLREMNERSNP